MLSLPVANSPHGLGELDCSAHPIPHARISALRIEHDDLDSAVDALVAANTHDDLIIARLKKRRLQIRDEIAAIMAWGQMRDAGTPDEAIPVFERDANIDADIDALGPDAMSAMVAAPRPGGGSFVFGVFVTLLAMLVLVLGLGWSEIVDSVNQTLAQIYLLSFLAAANG
jgi:hypothetical protein